MSALIGIDFGTSYLRMAMLKDGKPQPVGAALPIWQAAGFAQNLGVDLQLRSGLYDAAPIAVAGEKFPRQALAVRVLQAAKRQAEKTLDQALDGCVLCVPSRAGNLPRECLRQALKDAGFKVGRLLNETTAVALSQSRPSNADHTLLVFCLGAGGLDVNVAIRTPRGYTSLASGGSDQISGQQFTSYLADFLLQQVRLRAQIEIQASGLMRSRLVEEAERVKILLSKQEEVEVNLLHLYETAPEEWLDLQLTIQRQQFEELIAQPVVDSLNICQQLLTDLHLAPVNLQETWLAGGSTSIPALHKGMTEWLGKAPSAANEYAAAFGAALFTSTLEQTTPAADKTDQAQPALMQPDSGKPGSEAEGAGRALTESDRLLKAGDFDGALQQLGMINLLLQKKRARVMYEQGFSKESDRDYTSAKQYYGFANRIDRGNEDYKEALRRLQRQEARVVYPDARKLEKAGDLENAIKKYQACVDLDQDNYDYSRAYAHCLALLALKKRANAVKQENSDPTAQLNAILKQLNQALSIAPNEASVKRKAEAFTIFMKAMQLQYKNKRSSRAKITMVDYFHVQELLKQACNLDPEDKYLKEFYLNYSRKFNLPPL